MGIDIGAHRKKLYGTIPTVEGEMMRRAFWYDQSFTFIVNHLSETRNNLFLQDLGRLRLGIRIQYGSSNVYTR